MNQEEAKGFVADAEEIAEREFHEGCGLTKQEWRRLAFLRWRIRTGRLTEWAEDEPERAGPPYST
jgi:hypothetical protein